MKHKLISVALITILLFMVLGNGVGCTSTTNYTLTISSTAGGSVTPAVGAHTYSAGTVVNLTATPDAEYHFVNWTGNVANVNAAATIITMNSDHTVTANFGFDMTYIDDVPDTSQPPTQTLPSTNPNTNYCAPMAMINIALYWNFVMGHANAENVTACLPAKTAAEYLGYFMDTNNTGSPARGNDADGHPGTYDKDIAPGTVEFVRWDASNLFLTPPPNLPAGKLGYNWTVTQNCTTDYNSSLAFYKAEIDAGRPLVVSFSYWNPMFTQISYPDPETEETINVFAWGEYKSYSTDPVEYWDEGIGHAVTGVGYILNWDPDGSGPLPSDDYVIVHDNWVTTPENIALPWANWKCLFAVDPGSEAGLKVFIAGETNRYAVYGGNHVPIDWDDVWAIQANPENKGYLLLGTAIATAEFHGTYDYYLIKPFFEESPIATDALQLLSTGMYLSGWFCCLPPEKYNGMWSSNVELDELYGPPDGQSAAWLLPTPFLLLPGDGWSSPP